MYLAYWSFEMINGEWFILYIILYIYILPKTTYNKDLGKYDTCNGSTILLIKLKIKRKSLELIPGWGMLGLTLTLILDIEKSHTWYNRWYRNEHGIINY